MPATLWPALSLTWSPFKLAGLGNLDYFRLVCINGALLFENWPAARNQGHQVHARLPMYKSQAAWAHRNLRRRGVCEMSEVDIRTVDLGDVTDEDVIRTFGI